MSWTEEDLAAIEDHLKRGVTEVDYPGGQRIKYGTISEMRRVRSDIILDLNKQKQGGRGGGHSLVRFK